MKTSIRIFTISLLLLHVGCGVKKSTQSKIESTQEEMATKGTNESQEETLHDGSDNTNDAMQATSISARPDDTVRNDGTKDNTETAATPKIDEIEGKQLYAELEMTNAQVQDFGSEMKAFKTKQQNMANGEMLGTVAKEKERVLERILSPDQFSTYQNLKKNN